jgi:hypothetical protein
VLNEILHDPAASPRHKIESARELRATAAIGSEASKPTADRERFVIRINFGGGNSINKEFDLKRDEEDLKLIERDEAEDKYDWYRD